MEAWQTVIRDLALVHHDSSSVTMETGKPGLASAPMHISSVATQRESRMDIQAPLTTVYIHTLPALPAQPYHQPPAAVREPATLHLAVPSQYSKEAISFLTLHVASELQSQPGPCTAGAVNSSTRLKSAGKHVCRHCGRDCMKPSVLEKHLRCHTGERPYPCTTCGVSFKTQSNLYKHRRTQAHARLSSESEQSSVGSLDNSLRETCTSSLSLDEHVEESDSVDRDVGLPGSDSTSTKSIPKVHTNSYASKQSHLNVRGHSKEQNELKNTMKEDEINNVDGGEATLTVSRHLTLRRQEATLFSKQWQSSLSRGKSQSHESTDSGFSESTDQYLSPSSVLPEQSQESVSESTQETPEMTPFAETCPGGPEPNDTGRKQEQKTLEERILKLISENTAVVEDKQLENVRPRKTILSKQGSIDLPMPYTYKDSFHFEMRNSQTLGSNINRKPVLYSSVPTQRSSTVEHAPLTRSNSLPFSVTLLQPEKSSSDPSCQSDYMTLACRGSSGQINPAGFPIRPVNQHSSTHHPLVRQTAVDCNHATDGLLMNSSVEEASGSFSCDMDRADICGEPSNRKFRRKKAQKFAYNKWYMYGGGTFKKLYSPEKCIDSSVIKGKKCSANPGHDAFKRLTAVQKETDTVSGSVVNVCDSASHSGHLTSPVATLPFASPLHLKRQMRTVMAPLRRNLSLSVLPSLSIGSSVSQKTDYMNRTEAGGLISQGKHSGLTSQLVGPHIPSNRKKQRTDCKSMSTLEVDTIPITVTCYPPSDPGTTLQQGTNITYINLNKTVQQSQLEAATFPPSIINASVSGISTLPAASITSPAQSSFLPKYQLKLPNTMETASAPVPHLEDICKGNFTSTLSPVQSEVSSVTMCVVSSSESAVSSATITHNQLLLPRNVTTLCQNLTSSLAVTHRQLASATKTTSCLQDHQAGLCSTSVQFKSETVSTLMQISNPVVQTTPPAVLTLTTENSLTSVAAPAFPHLPYDSPNPPSHLPTVTDNFSSANRPAGLNTPMATCHVVSLDQAQPTPQNVFHVHTADLQICLQIISDEQLALIEPQIERLSGSSLSQELTDSVQNEVGSFITTDSTMDTRNGQKQIDKSEHLLRKTPLLSAHFGKPSFHLAEGSVSNQVLVSAEPSIPSGALNPLLHPHNDALVNMETQSSVGDLMSTDTSSGGVKLERSQTSEEAQALFLNHASDEQVQQKVGGSDLCQHKLHVSSLSPNSVCQSNRETEQLDKEQIPQNEGGSLQTTGDAFRSRRLEAGESPCQVPGEVQVSACSNKLYTTFSQTPFKPEIMGWEKVGPLNDHSFESQDERCLGLSGKGQLTFEPSNIEKPKNILDVQATTYSTKTGPLEEPSARLGEKIDRALKQNQAAEEILHPCQEEGQERGLMRKKGGGAIKVNPPRLRHQAKSDCRVPSDETMGEDREVITNSWLSEQFFLRLSQTGSGMSKYPPQSPEQDMISETTPARVEENSNSLAQQVCEHTTKHQKTEPARQSSSNQHTGAENLLSEEQNMLSGVGPGPTPQNSAQSSSQLIYGNNSCGDQSLSENHHNTSHSPDAGILVSRKDIRSPPKMFICPEHVDHESQLLHLDQPVEALRPLQGCQDFSQDSSSSDDEGKLIIEL
ncbi:unnamed protein product [Ophioblennius macclurei]